MKTVFRVVACGAAVLVAGLHGEGLAQTIGDGGGLAGPTTIATEYIERQNVSDRLQPHDSGLLGDQIDLNTGSVVFSHVDVLLPGNSGLEVALRRVRQQNFPFPHLDAVTVPASISNDFSDWALDVPSISITIPMQSEYRNFCTNHAQFGMFYTFPPGPPSFDDPWFQGFDISNGMHLNIPGAGSQHVLDDPQGVSWPTGTIKTTSGYWAILCGPAAGNGAQGLIAIAPNGDRYRFDRFAYRPETALRVTQGGQQGAFGRKRATLYASEITDVHGNWVRYTYDSGLRVTRIHANDGRDITITRNGVGLIQSVSAHGRTWTYGYASTSGSSYLSTVTLPDGRGWSFSMAGFGSGPNPGFDCAAPDRTISLTHPDGITGTFIFRETRHLKGYTGNHDGPSESCLLLQPVHQPFYDHMSLHSRQLSGPGYPAATWAYSYSGASSGPPPATKWGQVIEPDGTRTRTTYHRSGDLEGLAQRTQVYQGSALMRQTDYQYVVEAPVGTTFLLNENAAKLTRPRHVTHSVLAQGGDTYTTQSGYVSNMGLSTYSFGHPTSVSRSSTLQTGTRTTQTSYTHNQTRWILGLPQTVTQNGVVAEANTYNALGQLTRQDRYGALHATLGYHTSGNQAGTLAWVRDALNRQTSFASYMRGIPGSITLPDGETMTAAVNNHGWVTSATNPRGHATSYSYNAAGWVTAINRPESFASTTISYSGLGAGVVQASTTGSLRVTTTHDSMLRPTLVRQQALSGGGGNIYTRTQYDALGRVTFASFPSASSNPTQGVTTAYDALGRVVQTQENVAPMATTATAYLSGNRTRVTDPSGNVTTTTASGYGGPGDGAPVLIAHPMGLSTVMTYDIRGNLLTARQHGSHNGYSADHTQRWFYDARQRVCRHSVPETGDTLYGYDAAGQLIRIARGQPTGTACTTPPSGSRVTQVWDARGRLAQVQFPDSSPNIVLGYDANGNLTSAVRGAAGWSYQHDALGALISETLAIDGHSFATSYTRNANGFVTHRVTPGGRTVSYLPDGFGRPTRVQVGSTAYASGAGYHPSGGLASLSYGNGHALSQSYNARHLVTGMSVSGSVSVLGFGYSHDASGRVTSITDSAVSGQNRAFGYDGLGRLITASGPWGSGSFIYDPLGNVRRQTLGSRVVDVDYNALNRVSRVRDTATGNVWRNYAYDARGNTTSNGQLGWSYDRSEQPVSMSGAVAASFAYDAHRRRARQTIAGETIYSVYTSDGALAFRRNATTGETTDYLRLGSRTIARLNHAGAVTYTYADHLGSPAAAANAAGSVVWRENHAPFGEARQRPVANDNAEGFTGHVADAATGLVYMQARYYDPAIGRFLSSDPVGFAQGGPGYFNRYAYVMNDPVNATDPTGMCPRCLAAAGRVGVRTVRYGGNVGRATRETWHEIRHDAGMLVAADSSGAQRAAALFNLASPISTRDLQAAGNWVFNESAEGSLTTPDGNRVRSHGSRGDGGQYLAGKGHTPDSVDGILNDHADSYPTATGDTSTGGRQGATAIFGQNGDWAVVNDETGEVIQVNDRNNPRQGPPRRREPEDD